MTFDNVHFAGTTLVAEYADLKFGAASQGTPNACRDKFVPMHHGKAGMPGPLKCPTKSNSQTPARRAASFLCCCCCSPAAVVPH